MMHEIKQSGLINLYPVNKVESDIYCGGELVAYLKGGGEVRTVVDTDGGATTMGRVRRIHSRGWNADVYVAAGDSYHLCGAYNSMEGAILAVLENVWQRGWL